MPERHAIDSTAVLDAIDGGVIVLDTGARVVRWNHWMEVATGVPQSQALGSTLAQVFADVDLKRLPSAIDAALKSGASTLMTHALNPALLPLRSRAMQPIYHDITVSAVGTPEVTGCLIFIADVTMVTRREKLLRARQDARYDAVVARAADVILTVDDEGTIQFANPAAESQFGFSSADLVGRAAAELFDTTGQWNQILRDALDGTGSSLPVELVARRKDSSLTWLEASASQWKNGARIFVTVILRDINQRRATEAALRAREAEARTSAMELTALNQTLEERVHARTAQLMKAEEALRQSQKMEAIGNLTGGIAHDFNNLLHVISGNLHLLKREVAGNPVAKQRLQKAIDGVVRSAKLSSQLLAFARRQPLDPKVIHVERYIREVDDLLRKAVGEGVVVEMKFEEGLWNTLADPGNLENALLNLVINARDAMEGVGVLRVDAGNVTLATDYTKNFPEATPGDYVEIAVTDTGSGMAPEVMQKAFDPFFTTKSEGRGTGLGLSMVYGFVKQSGGHIAIESELGQGTTIRVYLPRSLQLEEQLVSMESLPVLGGNEMVLVAEDDESVRETVVAMLNDLGYRVIKAKDAMSALNIIESGMPIDLLFSDVVMPGPLQSTELARKARERMPHLAVLFTSGYPENAITSAGRLDPGVDLLSKPYSKDALARRVRLALEKAAAGRRS